MTASTNALPARPELSLAAAEWWRGAVIYQIYPWSFKDTNGDGIGDLPGIIDGLDYVKDLGVDGVWLSPFFRSPMRDFGYDVSDYCDVDPLFGTLADFDRLVTKAKRLGLKIVIDQVYSHTSDRHAWFAESRSNRDNARADWYVWADPKADGSPPNNWQSVFGGPAWTWDSRRSQYYFHNFLSSQPDLNLHNPDVQNALLDVARFWLDRGVDGFRLDAINFGMHDPLLRDNPPAPKDGRRVTRPFDLQRHVHSMSQPGVVLFLERLRAVLDGYDARFTVAEVGGAEPMAEMKAFTAGDTRLNTAYGFDFLYAQKISPALPRRAMGGWPGEAGEGWPSWAFSNHDAPRAVSRWADEKDRAAAARLFLMLLMSLRGNVFLYQGEELGLPQGKVAFEDLKDPEAIANWPLTLGRDGARTPLPWVADRPHAGFTTGQPWLPVDPRHPALSVAEQEKDKASMLAFTRRMIALRAAHPALRLGAVDFVDAAPSIVVFFRRHGAETLLCAFNLGADVVEWRPADSARYSVLAQTSDTADVASAGGVPERLAPYAGYIARLK